LTDTERLDWLEENAKPTTIDGRPEALAVVVVYHLKWSLREAIDALAENTGKQD
jgi:hypothetical protein